MASTRHARSATTFPGRVLAFPDAQALSSTALVARMGRQVTLLRTNRCTAKTTRAEGTLPSPGNWVILDSERWCCMFRG
jgi:hypothetical protein